MPSSPRSQGNSSEISRGDDDGLHSDLVPVLSHVVEGEEELCAAAAAAVAGSGEEVAVYVRRAGQDPGAAGGDTHPK